MMLPAPNGHGIGMIRGGVGTALSSRAKRVEQYGCACRPTPAGVYANGQGACFQSGVLQSGILSIIDVEAHRSVSESLFPFDLDGVTVLSETEIQYEGRTWTAGRGKLVGQFTLRPGW